MKMTDNTVLITGGGSGIGEKLAEEFHKLGNQVIIAGRTWEKLDETVAANPGMKAFAADLADSGSIKKLAADVTKEFPKINTLIHNAGMMKNEDLLDGEDVLTTAEMTINTNLLAPMRLTEELLPVLRKQTYATIMTVTSGLAFVPKADTPTYSATKAAIHSYTQSLRYQLRDTAIQVIELVPPYVATYLQGERQANDPMAMPLDEFIFEVMEILKTQPDAEEILVKKVHLQRFMAESGQEKYDEFFKKFNDMQTAIAKQ